MPNQLCVLKRSNKGLIVYLSGISRVTQQNTVGFMWERITRSVLFWAAGMFHLKTTFFQTKVLGHAPIPSACLCVTLSIHAHACLCVPSSLLKPPGLSLNTLASAWVFSFCLLQLTVFSSNYVPRTAWGRFRHPHCAFSVATINTTSYWNALRC